MAGRGSKNLRVRTSARSVSKGMEKELKRKAKRLSQDVDLVLPRCTVEVPHFKKLRRQLEEVRKYSSNRTALEKFSKKGDKIVRAYAGTLMLLHEEKIAYLAIFKGPFGEAVYAMRGSTGAEKLVGVQHYDDPRIKMMAYLEDVKKKNLYMFITEDELICTGSDPKPPKEVLEPLPKRLGKGMRRSRDTIHSSDIDPAIVSGRLPNTDPYMIVRWKSADLDMARTLTHAQQNQDNMFATCAQYLASPKISQFFTVDSVVRPICENGEECPCHPIAPPQKKESFLQRIGKPKEETDEDIYLQGKMMDHRYIEKARERYEGMLKEAGKTVYIIENRCLGSSREKMVRSLSPKPSEKDVLSAFMDLSSGPVISTVASVNLVIGPFWSDLGERILVKVVKDERIAKKAFKDFPYPRYQPMTVVDEARYLVEEGKLRSVLKPPKDPPRMIEFAYECAINYMTRGQEGASKVVERFHDDDIKVKAAKYAFIKQLGLEKVGGWSYTTHEVGYAQGMGPIVEKIVTKDPSRFREGLKELWKATGSTQDLVFQ